MKGKILASLVTLSLLGSVISAETPCNAQIEVASEDTQVSFDKMFLEVYTPEGVKQEQSQCTPDGNCFVVIYNLEAFGLRMRGPQGSLFEPREYKIDTSKNQRCDDLGFRLKGFSLRY